MSKWSDEHKKLARQRYINKMKKSKRAMKNPITTDIHKTIVDEIKTLLTNEKRWHFGSAICEEILDNNPEFVEMNEKKGKTYRVGHLNNIFKFMRQEGVVEFRKIGNLTFYKYTEKLETFGGK